MSGSISAGGLITGLDTNTLISQLLLLERQPILRFESRISNLEGEKTAVSDLRGTLQTLRNSVQDFRLLNIFDKFTAATSEENVLNATVNSSSPVTGTFDVNVTQLATATVGNSSSRVGAAINANTPLVNSGISTTIDSGTFSINGVQFNLDAPTTSLTNILDQINSSAADVTATYDSLTDTVTFENTTPNDTSLINFGASGDTSNFLSAIAVTQSTQAIGGNGSTTATSTRNLGAVDAGAVINTLNFENGAVTTGAFSINGVSISIDPATDTLSDLIERINNSDAGVSASYDGSIDGLRVVSETLGSPTVRFGSTGDTSNFLSVANLDTAAQTAGKDSQFTINGGPVQTRNTNEVSDAVGGVAITFLSVGTSTISVGSDTDAIVEEVNEFVAAFNDVVNQIRTLTGTSGDLAGDGTIRGIENFLRSNIFGQVLGLGEFESLLDIGINTGDEFDSTGPANLVLDEEKFRQALLDDRQNVEKLFANDGETGIADALFGFLDETTKATGYLNQRAKSNGTIDTQIQSLNDQIARLEDRISLKETRLRRQFTHLEQLSAGFQNQSAALGGLSGGFGGF